MISHLHRQLPTLIQGNYRVVLGRNAVGKVIAYGGGDFGREKFHSLRLPTDYVDDAEKPLIEDDQIALTVVIQLDGFPEETGTSRQTSFALATRFFGSLL